MIDWDLTREKLGITNISGYRPKVVCRCDKCNKEKIITIRIKSQVINNNIDWECPKCVSSRKEIREKLKSIAQEIWEDPKYQKIQKEKSQKLWKDPEYRKTISNKNSCFFSQETIKKQLKEKYSALYATAERKEQFRKSSLDLWKSQDFKRKMIRKFNSEEYKRKISESVRERWKDPKYQELMAQYRLNMPKVSSIQDALYSLLDDLGVEYYREYLDRPNDPETRIGPYCVDCVIPRKDNLDLIIECQGDYWHSSTEAQIRDKAKATYFNKYFSNRYELKYLWEHEFLNKDRVLTCLQRWLRLKSIKQIDFDYSDVIIKKVTSGECKQLLTKYHYLAGVGRGGIAYASYLKDKMMGVCIFSPLLRGNMFSNLNIPSRNIRELSRLCIHPAYNKKNFGSWFISRCLKRLKRDTNCELVSTYADSTFNHDGTIYKAANFKFDGIVKPSYWYVSEDGWVMHKKTLYNHARSLKMTEKEFADLKNYRKVWGKQKYRYLYYL